MSYDAEAMPGGVTLTCGDLANPARLESHGHLIIDPKSAWRLCILLEPSLATGNMGVTKDIIKEGDGVNYPKKGDKLSMHYTGTLSTGGKKFDSSRDRGTPFSFKIGKGEVIKGWDEGVIKMSLGEKAILHITSDYGYGSQGAGGPPYADLDFEVELLAIGDKRAKTESGCGCNIV